MGSSDAPLMLSISGLRGLVGSSLTPPLAARYGGAFGSWLVAESGKSRPHVVVGRDSRPSGLMVQQAVVSGLIGAGCRVTTLEIVMTPTLAVMIDELKADGGMVITASHNPLPWNGIKALRQDGSAPEASQARQIIDRFHQEKIDWRAVEGLGSLETDERANELHIERVMQRIDKAAIAKLDARVVLDSVHGAGGPATADMLRRLGVQCVHLYGEPTGLFPHNPEPTAENLTGLAGEVVRHKADIGFAQDPDADRLALVDENGRYIGEEYTLALCAMQVLGKLSRARALPPGPVTAANLSTSRMIDDVAAAIGATVVRTPVGEAHVAMAMRQGGLPIGGEGNGGVIWPVISSVRDSLAGIGLILQLLADTGKSLSQLVATIPSYTILKEKLPIQPGMAEAAIGKLKLAFADSKIDLQDGIRIDRPEGWVHLRPSNTEPILRIIAEARQEADARSLIERVRKAMG